MLHFFFFQAEDGIRDGHVTGVQTCALPIWPALGADEAARYLFRRVVEWGRSSNVFLRNGGRLYLDVGSHPEYATAERSEERRVGKEGRCRWSRDQQKK